MFELRRYLLPRGVGVSDGHAEVVDGMYRERFLVAAGRDEWGATAETLADRYGI